MQYTLYLPCFVSIYSVMDQLIPVQQEIQSGKHSPGPTERASLTVNGPGDVAPSVVDTMNSQDDNINNFHRVILRGSRQHGQEDRTFATLVPSVALITKLLRRQTGANRVPSALYRNPTANHQLARKSTTALELSQAFLSQFHWTDEGKIIESEIKAEPTFRDGSACTVKYVARPTELFRTGMTIQDDRTGQRRSYVVAKGQFPWPDVPDDGSHVQGDMMATGSGSGWRDMPTPLGLGIAFNAGDRDACAITGLAESLQAWQPTLGVQGNGTAYFVTRTDRISVGGVPYTVATTVSPVDGDHADRTSIGNDDGLVITYFESSEQVGICLVSILCVKSHVHATSWSQPEGGRGTYFEPPPDGDRVTEEIKVNGTYHWADVPSRNAFVRTLTRVLDPGEPVPATALQAVSDMIAKSLVGNAKDYASDGRFGATEVHWKPRPYLNLR